MYMSTEKDTGMKTTVATAAVVETTEETVRRCMTWHIANCSPSSRVSLIEAMDAFFADYRVKPERSDTISYNEV